MTKPSISLEDLRRRLYVKAKAESSWRFWGLYVHVCKMETLQAAYAQAKANDGSPGIDGVTFADIERDGVDGFLGQIRADLQSHEYRPTRNRRQEIPKPGGKIRVLGIPTIRDRVVQGALKLILEPIFEADFQPGSYGYRPKRHAHDALSHVAEAIVRGKTRVIDLDLRSYFDNVRHHLVLAKVAGRVNDRDVMWLLKAILKATGKRGVPQGGVISPLLSNIYLNEVDRMLERGREITRCGGRTRLEYARYADDLVVLVDGHAGGAGLLRQVEGRIREELAKLDVEVNEEKSRVVDLVAGESFTFLGFEVRRIRSRKGRWRPSLVPRTAKRTELLRKLGETFRSYRSQPVARLIQRINPMVRGWVNYFGIGDAKRTLSYVRRWVEKKVRRHLMGARGRGGFGWKRWSTRWLHDALGLFDGYRVRLYYGSAGKALPARAVP